MCRSIRTLRPPYAEQVTEDEVRAAALQYVRKVAGMRAPSAVNAEAFAAAVEEVSGSTARLLEALVLRPTRTAAPRPEGSGRGAGPVEREAQRDA